MTKPTFTSADARIESALWPDGPRCPRCPDSRRFVRDKSRDGRWHRCLSCYTCTSAAAGTFLHGVRTPLPLVLAAFELIEREPGIKPKAVATAVGFTHTVARNMIALWAANRNTTEGQRLATLFAAVVPAKALLLLHPSHPLHGLL